MITPTELIPLNIPRSVAAISGTMPALFVPNPTAASPTTKAGYYSVPPDVVHRKTRPDAYRMIKRRAKPAGIETKIGNHSLRATGITDYRRNNGTLEHAQTMANHSIVAPVVQLRGPRRDEYERIGI